MIFRLFLWLILLWFERSLHPVPHELTKLSLNIETDDITSSRIDVDSALVVQGLWPWSGQIWFHCFYDQNWIFSENVILYIAQPVHSWELCQKPPFTASQAVLWSLSGYSEPKVPFKVAQGQMG